MNTDPNLPSANQQETNADVSEITTTGDQAQGNSAETANAVAANEKSQDAGEGAE